MRVPASLAAVSMFGLLPAALMSVDLGRLLDRAESMLNACHGADSNPGLELGLALGSAWQEGRDKVVFPFENMGSADDQYFAAGISEEITSRLSALSGLTEC